MTTNIRDINRLYSIYDVLGIDRRKRVIVCPLPFHTHYHNTPSFSIYPGTEDGFDRFYCHGNCNKQGDVIDLVGYMNIPGYDGNDTECVRRAISILTQNHQVSFATPQRKAVSVLANNAWRQYPIGVEGREYAKLRGLTPQTVSKFRLGQKANALMIPIFCDDLLYAIKFRRISGYGMRYWSARGSKKALFNVDNVKGKEEPVLILKGEIAVMLMDQLGFNACCLTGGEGAKIEVWKHYLAFATQRILVGDNDIDPETRRKMQAIARERSEQWNAELHFPPEGFKDIDEWVLNDDGATSVIERWQHAR